MLLATHCFLCFKVSRLLLYCYKSRFQGPRIAGTRRCLLYVQTLAYCPELHVHVGEAAICCWQTWKIPSVFLRTWSSCDTRHTQTVDYMTLVQNVALLQSWRADLHCRDRRRRAPYGTSCLLMCSPKTRGLSCSHNPVDPPEALAPTDQHSSIKARNTRKIQYYLCYCLWGQRTMLLTLLKSPSPWNISQKKFTIQSTCIITSDDTWSRIIPAQRLIWL